MTTHKRLACFDLETDRMVWSREYPGGCDRLAIAPDGHLLYVPSFEGPHWHVLKAATGEVVATVVTNSGAHNTIYGPDGRHVYLAGLKSPMLMVADSQTHKVVRVDRAVRQHDPPVHHQRRADACASSTSTSCSGSRSAT